ncbi:hypothetical protein CW745_09660 [Psychromonas sp. psych-6C06]|uniref:VIT and vWA domain-containing protein n=1 Tax=Psychromonas sp. psych-6C06 TaxID=2058089 RepID=UPI000C34094D|nr:VIT and VWA domain-containing protein [Psychromonas sp. psych-6C06]PKF61583.1 hypothetical protein CW745_09660 [Psychromonas sp. psych-6C06]
MKYFNYKLIATLLILFVSQSSFAAGLLKAKNANYQDLQINTHDVHVIVQDGYVRTAVEQTFYNPNNTSLEALYTFPVPEGAAVGEFSYWINGQEVIAEIVEKEQAKQIYQQQKQAGQEVALVEQNKQQAFAIKVYPVPAQDEVKIRLVYLQQATIDTGLGRYVYPLEEGGVDQAAQDFWTRNESVKQRFSFTMDIRSSYPLDGIRLPAHANAVITEQDTHQWQVRLTNSEQALADEQNNEEKATTNDINNALKLDTDILVYWRHQRDLPGRVDLITYREPGKKQGTFKLTLTPGDDLALNQGQRDWIFVLDKSGSMAGKYESLLEGVRQALDKLPSEDRYRIITFNNQADDITSGYQTVSKENVQQSLNKLLSDGVNGGTNLYAGIKTALSSLDSDRASALILVSDGVANVGVVERKKFLNLLDKKDVRLYSFIMGNSANRALLEGMSNVSNGFYASISNADDLMGQVMLATSKMTHQAMRDIQFNIDGVKATDLSHNHLNTLYRGQQLTFFGHYYGEGSANIELTAKVNGKNVSYQTTIKFDKASTAHPELERLWAFSKIKQLQAEKNYLGEGNADSEQAIRDIALQYGLVTEYTSLIVVEDAVFEQFAIERSNKKRVEKERVAQQQKQKQAVQSNRVDKEKPMFNSPSPNLGGGTMNLLWLLLLVFAGGIKLLLRKGK